MQHVFPPLLQGPAGQKGHCSSEQRHCYSPSFRSPA
uniref:Putative zinc finger protein 238 variant 1 n=1 Tax=Taeniopygia guttata TaxID=59729 RepID=B5FZD3_TAEGU|nr:putative zinc finger protein 238 variant 1 [Taeniopygia guttata]